MRRILKKIRNALIQRKIKKKAIVANNVNFTKTAQCINSGDKSNVNIGEHCVIGATFYALYGGKITVGNNVYIGSFTSIQSKEKIEIGNNVIIANNVLLVDNNNHPTSPRERMKMCQCDDFLKDELWSWKYAESKPIVIEDNVWLGRDSRILKGVTVGKGSIVALGAVVTRDVPPYSVVAGNPAKVVKELSPLEESL